MLMARSHLERSPGASLSQFRFLNRQNLYLRPDPARVVVRPFKPATEPRDLNPTDKIRANHIVGRVVRLDPEAAAQQLTEVLESFEGRHRNLRADCDDGLQNCQAPRSIVGRQFRDRAELPCQRCDWLEPCRWD